MARGIRLEVDTDLMNRCVWLVEFLTDEWDRESSIGQVACQYREDALALGRLWLYNKAHTIEQLEFAQAHEVMNRLHIGELDES